ncbi:hypothetical protein IM40_00260 [Candidatus Paracaedimonas acanthamoebae]|nr:hypothetical protein IM40_00260 [Candidatus Paracaedimonas acanthamoebae]
MLHFKYCALTNQGRKKRGIIAASSLKEVQHRLAERGEYLLRCREQTIHWRFFRSRNDNHLEEICIHFKEMSQAGIPLLDVLDSVKQSSPSLQFKSIFEDIYYLVENGASLSEAMNYFPQVFNQTFLGTIKAAETTGELVAAFEQLAILLNEQRKFKMKVIQSLRYPIILLGMILLLASILSILVVPQIQTLIGNFGHEIPLSTHILIFLSDKFFFIIESIGVLLGIVGGMLFILSQLSQEIKCYCHQVVLKTPFIGELFKDILILRFFQIFEILYRNNINLFEAFETGQLSLNNFFVRRKLSEVIEKIKKGHNLHEAFKEVNFFAPYLSRMLKVGTQTGELAPCLHCITQHYRYNVEQKIGKLLAYLEPTGLLMIGGMMFWIVCAVFIPLYQQLTVLEL